METNVPPPELSVSPSDFAPTELSAGEEVASVRLGVTAHFRDPIDVLLPLFADTWQRLESRPWCQALQVLRSTRDVEPRGRPEPPLTIADEIRGASAHAALYGLRVDDGARLPLHAVELRAVHDFGEHPRSSYLRILLPVDAELAELTSLVDLLAETLPVWHGSAGLIFTYWAPEISIAFDQIFAWARRFYGPAIAYAPAETWDAPTSLSTINWMTLVSDAFVAAHLPDAHFDGALPGGVTAARRGSGWVLRAGDRPRLGDLHRFERLADHTSLARLLEPALPAQPTSYRGMFAADRCTAAWQRRWLDPMAWNDLQL